ncbi:1472_t:CDS:2 [Ambispora gerdemannii]|uniref:1472_t:CDS:1 n=1 Tax=Ambispora gerdemannii TaxID=144530 RepID=A0A9N9H3L3_9GLOM|nr:1472_t:CDS:2 [Ambispora gerdemannii]
MDLDIDKFYREGFLILENGLTPKELDCLRNECDALVNHIYNIGLDILEDFGCVIGNDVNPVQSKEKYKSEKETYRRYRLQISDEYSVDLILGKIARLAGRLLPSTRNDKNDGGVYLFNEQFIVKPPRNSRARFEWHQDSEYMDEKSRSVPSIACWIALDDMSKENGTLYIEPYPIIEVQAGTIIFMSGFVKHCSFGNVSSCFRRVYMPQYSAGIVYNPKLSLDQDKSGKQLLALGVPCLN